MNKKWGNRQATVTPVHSAGVKRGTFVKRQVRYFFPKHARWERNEEGHAKERTYLPLVVGTHIQVAQYDFRPDFPIKFLVRGPVVS